MTTLAKYIDMIARAPETEAASAAPAPKGRGSLPRKPKSTFNPMKAGKALVNDDDAIVQAYRSAVTAMQQADPELGGKPFTLEDDQILVTVRSVPGPSTEEVEGKRINALFQATGVEHKATVDVGVTNAAAEHETMAAADAAHFPASATETLRRMTSSNEFRNIAALVLRKNLLEDPNYGKDWLRSFPRIGYTEGKDGEDGRRFNTAERYKVEGTDKDRSRYVSYVADVWNKTPDGKSQLQQIALIEKARQGDESSPYFRMGPKVIADEANKWRSRNSDSIKTLRQAIHIEQVMQDIETAASNVAVEIKTKFDNQGNDTGELRNSKRPITAHDKDKPSGSMQEFSVADFVRIKPYKVADKATEKGPNTLQLKTTQARKTQPKKGQGQAETTVDQDIISGKKVLVSAKQALSLITVQLANYFDVGVSQPDRQDYLKRTADLQSLLTNKTADEDVLSFGYVLSELQDIFQPLSLRYSNMKRDKAEAEAGEAKAA